MSSVYAHVNKINNKTYIGFSKYDDPKIRWGNNGNSYIGQKFYNEGIAPFGWDNFNHIQLINNIPITLAKSLEFLLINKLDTINSGYNEDKGILYDSDADTASNMVNNLIFIIQQNKEESQLSSLGDIVNVKYTATTVSYRLEYIYDLYKKDRINTALDCQREYVWDETRQQGMWDTLLYGHRIPEIHAVRKPDGKYDIIDGKQRLLTLMKILDNEIPLKRLNTSTEIKKFMINNNVTSIYFKDMDEKTKNKIYDKEISVAEYAGVDDDMLVILFQKLNAGKPLSEFQKCLANNILVRLRYTQHFDEKVNNFIPKLFSPAELSANEDEVMLVRMLSTLNCGDIVNVDGLEQRNLNNIIKKMDIKTLISTREKISIMIEKLKELQITPEEIKCINKTWYPLLFKFFIEEIPEDKYSYFKNFISAIRIPPQRGLESTARESVNRYNSIKKDWDIYIKSLN